MARGINLAFLADVSSFLRGTKSATDSLDDIGDALDAVVADSAGAQAAMEADFRAIASEANASADKVGRGFDDAGDRATRSTGRVRDGLKGTGDELRQEGLSGAAAFDGSMESAADSAQAFSSVALSAFGPIGAGLGVAAAAGFGAFRAQAAKTKEAIDKLFDALVDGQGKLDDAFKGTTLEEWAKDGTLQRLADQARALGISYDTAVRAALGNATAMQQVAEATDKATEAAVNNQGAIGRGGQAYSTAYREAGNLNRQVETNAGTAEKAAQQYDLYADAVEGAGLDLEDTTDATDKATKATDANTDALRENADALLESRGLLRNVEQAYDDALAGIKEHGRGLDISTQKGRDNQAALDALADSILADGTVKDGEARKWEAVATAMGLSEAAADRLAAKLALIPTSTKVKVEVDVDEAALDNVRRKIQARGFRWDEP